MCSQFKEVRGGYESKNPLGVLNYRQEDNDKMDVEVTG